MPVLLIFIDLIASLIVYELLRFLIILIFHLQIDELLSLLCTHSPRNCPFSRISCGRPSPHRPEPPSTSASGASEPRSFVFCRLVALGESLPFRWLGGQLIPRQSLEARPRPPFLCMETHRNTTCCHDSMSHAAFFFQIIRMSMHYVTMSFS